MNPSLWFETRLEIPVMFLFVNYYHFNTYFSSNMNLCIWEETCTEIPVMFFSFTSIRRIFSIFIVFYWNWYQWKRILFRIFWFISHLSISIRDRATSLVNQANKITLEESFTYIVAENDKKRDMHVHFANTMTNQKYTSVFVIDRWIEWILIFMTNQKYTSATS